MPTTGLVELAGFASFLPTKKSLSDLLGTSAADVAGEFAKNRGHKTCYAGVPLTGRCLSVGANPHDRLVRLFLYRLSGRSETTRKAREAVNFRGTLRSGKASQR